MPLETKKKRGRPSGRTNQQARDRAMAMVEMYSNGETMESIGRRYGVTRERVRQILCQYGGGHEAQYERTQQKMQRRRDRRKAAQNERYLAKYGCTWEQYQTGDISVPVPKAGPWNP